ncbi:30S ribosomal protein S13 [Sphaerisporangium krabiense]|uniref:Putative flap endonuclease-1-like 5' DNA nuclease n=1 Tax=Sphaerisporangium krabiense TaxID=763782 RepID=A0A7W8ZBR5_9ACTN|nr:integration host factor, actinobacterial type [Sphaerisporangium krabiense]MBB5631084.1 putative flap endonuclease-1-like 5' DNA nuclease [Sphaerisporangium krabiense]GII65969.1 30S ribosomal protein S13 [Sphaerisporangium krabiense]
MALPVLTPEQRQAALVKATEARQARAALLARLKAGELTLAQLFDRDDETAKKIKVSQALRALSGIGPTKAAALMERAGVDEKRRVGGLGAQQRRKLVEAITR